MVAGCFNSSSSLTIFSIKRLTASHIPDIITTALSSGPDTGRFPVPLTVLSAAQAEWGSLWAVAAGPTVTVWQPLAP